MLNICGTAIHFFALFQLGAINRRKKTAWEVFRNRVSVSRKDPIWRVVLSSSVPILWSCTWNLCCLPLFQIHSDEDEVSCEILNMHTKKVAKIHSFFFSFFFELLKSRVKLTRNHVSGSQKIAAALKPGSSCGEEGIHGSETQRGGIFSLCMQSTKQVSGRLQNHQMVSETSS